MTRNYEDETKRRIEFIREAIAEAGAAGIVYGNSGGKDSALVGALCKLACENTLGIIMPCGSSRNYGEDTRHAEAAAERCGIETRTVDLTAARSAQLTALKACAELTDAATANIAPRLRMITLYAVAASENRLVAGTGNRSETYMGYFTKWGDGAYDINPIADLTVTEVYEFLRYLNAPECIIEKPPSAGLFDGQTDEDDMGVTYKSIDAYITAGTANDADKAIIERYHNASAHKRRPPLRYGD